MVVQNVFTCPSILIACEILCCSGTAFCQLL